MAVVQLRVKLTSLVARNWSRDLHSIRKNGRKGWKSYEQNKPDGNSSAEDQGFLFVHGLKLMLLPVHVECCAELKLKGQVRI